MERGQHKASQTEVSGIRVHGKIFITKSDDKRAGEKMKFEKVEGVDKGKIVLYALSTCVWCKRTKQFLSNLGVKFEYIFVDLLQGTERDSIMKDVEKWNPRCSFPTMVIGDSKCIVGFKEDEIREALK
jgi:glutaredoxin